LRAWLVVTIIAVPGADVFTMIGVPLAGVVPIIVAVAAVTTIAVITITGRLRLG
jgi:hypothetical protein